MEKIEIENILLRFKLGQKTLDESTNEILRLFSVSNRSELLLAFSSKLMYDMGLDFENQDEYIERFLASNSH